MRENDKLDLDIRLSSIVGWILILSGLFLSVFLIPLNKLFFGRYIFEDTFEKLLLHITLIFIGAVLLNRRKLLKELQELRNLQVKKVTPLKGPPVK